MRIRQDKIAELAKLVNEKARELQNVQESVDRAKLEIREFVERKQRLVKEANDLEISISQKKEHFNHIAQSEQQSLSSLEKEAALAKGVLEDVKNQIIEQKKELEECQSKVREFHSYSKNADQAREIYLVEKEKLDKAQSSIKELLERIEKETKFISQEKKEMGEYKNYLTDFYGKVATYAVTAQEILSFVNESLAENIPLRFEPPTEPITMDNFNK